MSDSHYDLSQPVRVVIQQPALPNYRIPVFRALAQQPGLELTVVYAETKNLTNVVPEGFSAVAEPIKHLAIGSQHLMWHRAQWDYATQEKTDVLILSWDLHYASLIPALLRARANRVPTILWGHGYSKQEATWRAWPRRKVAELATALLFYNHTIANRFIQEYDWDPARVFVALNALDQAPIQAARQHWLDRPEQLAAFRREKGLQSGPVILFVSRLDPANRVELLLRASAQLRSQFPSLRIVIIGKGPDAPALRDLAQSLDMQENVIFAGAIYDEMQLAPWFLSSAVFCYPANIGLSILHAFGYGLPVVTSDRIESQNPEIEALRPEQNGVTYQHGSAEALAGQLERLLADQDLRDRLSAQAHITATEQFTLQNMVDGFEAAIRFTESQR